MRDDVSAVLRSYDEAQKHKDPNATGLEKIWLTSFELTDTNQLVRAHLYEINVMFQKAFKEFFEHDLNRQTYLAELAKAAANEDSADGEQMIQYQEERDRLTKEKTVELDNMVKLGNTAVKLAAEYRKAKMSQSYYYHVSQIQQLFGLFIFILQKHVHQADVLLKIQGELHGAITKVCPDTIDVTEEKE